MKGVFSTRSSIYDGAFLWKQFLAFGFDVQKSNKEDFPRETSFFKSRYIDYKLAVKKLQSFLSNFEIATLGKYYTLVAVSIYVQSEKVKAVSLSLPYKYALPEACRSS